MAHHSARALPLGTLTMASAAADAISPPLNTSHRTIPMALDRGRRLQLIFDNRTFFRHRLLAARFGVLPRLPPHWSLLPAPASGAAGGAGCVASTADSCHPGDFVRCLTRPAGADHLTTGESLQ